MCIWLYSVRECVCVRARVCVCECVCVRARARMCSHAHAYVGEFTLGPTDIGLKSDVAIRFLVSETG